MKQVGEQADSAQTLDDEQVVQYLLTHPDFFICNARVIKQMVVPHPVRGCVSLLEWQLGRQRAHIQQLEDDITRLMEHASTNKPLFHRLLRLQSDLVAAGSLQELLNRLQRWARGLGLAGAHVRLFSDQWQLGAPSGFTHLALARSAFEPLRIQRLGQGNHYLGKLNGPELLPLPQVQQVASVAMSQLGDDGVLGVLMFTSRYSQHFQDGMGKVLLQPVGRTVTGAAGTLGQPGMTGTSSPLLPQVDAFLHYLRVEQQVSVKTRESYQQQLYIVIVLFDEMGLTEWRQLEVSQVRALAARSKRQGLQSASLALRLSALRSFLDWLVNTDALGANPARGVSAPRHGRHLPKNMDVDEVDHLLDIDPRDPLALRDRAMLEVMYGAGLHLAELVGLNCADMDLGGGEVRVVGKGNKERKLPVGATAVTWLTRWSALHDRYAPKDDAVFIANSGRRISARNVQKRFGEWGVKQGVNSHIHPHKLRYFFATHMLESSDNLLARGAGAAWPRQPQHHPDLHPPRFSAFGIGV